MFDLVNLARSANSAYSLATGGAFKAALDAMAIVELKAAQNAFSKADRSAHPREALNRALTHLESAHAALRQSWSSPVSGAVRRYKTEIQSMWDARTCCLIALIHHVLEDDRSLVLEALNDAQEAMKFEKVGGVIHIFNPINYMDIFTDWGPGQSELRIPSADYEQFKKIILTHR